MVLQSAQARSSETRNCLSSILPSHASAWRWTACPYGAGTTSRSDNSSMTTVVTRHQSRYSAEPRSEPGCNRRTTATRSSSLTGCHYQEKIAQPDDGGELAVPGQHLRSNLYFELRFPADPRRAEPYRRGRGCGPARGARVQHARVARP